MPNVNYRSLTVKQAKFVEAYNRNGGNASAAFREAYDCSNTMVETINRNAYRMTRSPKIAAHLLDHAKAREIAVERATQRGIINEEWVVERFRRIADADMRKLFYEDGRLKLMQDIDDDLATAIASIEVKETIGDNGTLVITHKIKRFNPQPALDSLAKYLKLYRDEPGTGAEAVSPEVAERRAKARALIEGLLQKMERGELIEAAQIPKKANGGANGNGAG